MDDAILYGVATLAGIMVGWALAMIAFYVLGK